MNTYIHTSGFSEGFRVSVIHMINATSTSNLNFYYTPRFCVYKVYLLLSVFDILILLNNDTCMYVQ
jgi:hypothetical protein